jgi:hypothetical protein
VWERASALQRPTWRPDIRAAVIAKARVNMHRKLRNMATMTGLYPLAVLSDCVVYPSPGDSPLAFLPYAASGKPQPGGFRLGPTPGLAKLEGVQSMLWAVDLMEQGHNPARHIKGRRVGQCPTPAPPPHKTWLPPADTRGQDPTVEKG